MWALTLSAPCAMIGPAALKSCSFLVSHHMAKTPTSSKRRRERRPNVPPYTGPIAPAEEAATAPTATSAAARPVTRPLASSTRASARSSASAVPAAGPVDFRKEYAYVLKDLRSMGIVAAIMLVLLVALNFIIP